MPASTSAEYSQLSNLAFHCIPAVVASTEISVESSNDEEIEEGQGDDVAGTNAADEVEATKNEEYVMVAPEPKGKHV